MQQNNFLQALPKAELHLHIEGAVPWEMVQSAVNSLPDPPPWWATEYRFENFGHFAAIIRQCYESTLTSIENYHLAAQGIFNKLVAQNGRYVELSFSLGHALLTKLPLNEIIGAIKQAVPANLVVRVFCGISRSRPELLQHNLIETLLDLSGLDGLDLHGDERAQGPTPFIQLFAQARQRGLALKAHAGELAGPPSMQAIINALQLTRIEHGVTAIEDERLMSRLIAENITLDMCPTSNIKLRVIKDVAAYPIKQFLQRGIRVTVSTDNPTILGCSLTDELQLLVDHFSFTYHDLAQLQVNAFQAALMPATLQAEILTELDNLLARNVLANEII